MSNILCKDCKGRIPDITDAYEHSIWFMFADPLKQDLCLGICKYVCIRCHERRMQLYKQMDPDIEVLREAYRYGRFTRNYEKWSGAYQTGPRRFKLSKYVFEGDELSAWTRWRAQ